MGRKIELFMAVVIIFVMGGMVFGYALLRQAPKGNENTATFPSVIERQLAPEERIAILQQGRTLIEYIYPQNCTECAGKAEMYRNFVESERFRGYATLSVAEHENATADWMTGRNGNRLELNEVNKTGELEDVFCDIAINQPDICILKDI